MNKQIGKLKRLIKDIRGQLKQPVGLQVFYKQNGVIDDDGELITDEELQRRYPVDPDTKGPARLIVEFMPPVDR